jgi:hypothetical protein
MFCSFEANSNFWIRSINLWTLVQLMPMANGRAAGRSLELCKFGQLATYHCACCGQYRNRTKSLHHKMTLPKIDFGFVIVMTYSDSMAATISEILLPSGNLSSFGKTQDIQNSFGSILVLTVSITIRTASISAKRGKVSKATRSMLFHVASSSTKHVMRSRWKL